MKLIKQWIVLSLAAFVLPYIVDGVSLSPWYTAFVVGACLLVIAFVVKPVLTILTLPLNLITLGLFSLIVNGALLYFLGAVVKGFSIDTFLAAFFASLVISVIHWIGVKVLRLN